MIKTITFLGITYAATAAVGLDQDVKLIDQQPTTDLLDLYNLVSANLGRGRVKRFTDAKTARRRTWSVLEDYNQQAEDVEAVQNDTDSFEASPAELAKQKPRAEVQAAKETTSTSINESGSKLTQDTSKPNSFKVELSDTDKAQIAAEAKDRAGTPASEAVLAAAAAAGSKAQAQAALRANPPASDNPAKDAEMPALRRAAKPVDLAPKAKVYPRKEGSKQAILVDLLSREEGATFGELYDGLAASGKPWRGVTIRSGLAWDINHIAGYGVTSELLNGEAFAAQGRAYEAHRLGMEGADFTTRGPGYDPELKLAVYRLTYPAGMDAPVPHIPRKS